MWPTTCQALTAPQHPIRAKVYTRGEAYSQLVRLLHSKEQGGSSLDHEIYLLALEGDNRSLAAYASIGNGKPGKGRMLLEPLIESVLFELFDTDLD